MKQRALISVFDKTHILPLAQALHHHNFDIISTGKTSSHLLEAGIPSTEISQITGFPELLEGRVKTLHPHIHAGLLADRNNLVHMETLLHMGIFPIDLVVVNLYPVEQSIDIGGPTLLRAAAKNYACVTVLSSPNQYATFIKHLENNTFSLVYRQELAAHVFELTAQYDAAIRKHHFPSEEKPLRYGENPHQKASVIIRSSPTEIPLARTAPLQGKPLSYNNLLDTDTAIFSLRGLTALSSTDPVCTVIKHATPCGLARGNNALELAFASDPVSAFGGIVAFSEPITFKEASFLRERFLEVIIAPEFSEEALSILQHKPNLRLLSLPTLLTAELPSLSQRSICGGELIQEYDLPPSNALNYKVVTQRQPSEEEWQALRFAFNAVIPAKSNAITLTTAQQLIGLGAGQTSRIDAVKLAIEKAKNLGHDVSKTVLGSDGFFPFKDNIELIAQAHIKAIIQPGGSLRDQEVIEAANAHGITMVFTGERHFRH